MYAVVVACFAHSVSHWPISSQSSGLSPQAIASFQFARPPFHDDQLSVQAAFGAPKLCFEPTVKHPHPYPLRFPIFTCPRLFDAFMQDTPHTHTLHTSAPGLILPLFKTQTR